VVRGRPAKAGEGPQWSNGIRSANAVIAAILGALMERTLSMIRLAL